MQFKYPELLYALVLLVIPIIVHLFQLRRFKKEAFTNVEFLKQVTLQTRKSSQLKKWLTLITRLLLLACIILAFAQPFTSKTTGFNKTTETVIYLDNSFSMQAKGKKGELLKRAVQDILEQADIEEAITLFTNDIIFRNSSVKALKNDLLDLNYSANQLNYDAALIKGKSYFSDDPSSLKRFIFISDFQQKEVVFTPEKDSMLDLNIVQLEPEKAKNIALDSLYISKRDGSNIEITTTLKHNGPLPENIPVSLFKNDTLIAKTSADLSSATAIFTLPEGQPINGEIRIDTPDLNFDNSLFFNINKPSKIKVLSINNNDDSYLKRMFSKDEFIYTSFGTNKLDYNTIDQQNLIILNEAENVPMSLNTALQSFTNNGGSLIVIPSSDADLSSYNSFLSAYRFTLNEYSSGERKITKINFSHPVYTGVFDNKVNNFQYPKTNGYYRVSSTGATNLLSLENNQPFLAQSGKCFLFSSALNKDNSNLTQSDLVITLYAIAKQSLAIPELYNTIGRNNVYDIDINLKQDDILTLSSATENIIPQQQLYQNKVTITTTETPSTAAIYGIKDKKNVIKYVSYNYNRSESDLSYQNVSSLDTATFHDSLEELFLDIKSDANINMLWKWFVIFALAFLIIEMLILKHLK
ncbi:BatA domain-containing protein [Mangrovimonas aestuarii]|uniref:BatA domain-containing protein n=1 Tax=Mangrovimonas aestuarii TaxID=3018443 RepID=UPI0023796F0A|nr:BatA domain-containing protein [Mangrovimonas aestuarii]